MRLSVQLLVALLASAQVSHSWVLTTNTLPTSIQNANKQVLRWGFPNPGQDRALSLGQGILYAISPEFLVDMVPLFPLEFLSADYLKESIGRGFSTWESNNANLLFKDITDIVPEFPGDAEVLITAITGISGVTDQFKDPTMDPKGWAALAIITEVTGSSTCVTTNLQGCNGCRSYAAKGNIMFNKDLCWYMDNSFCNAFMSLIEDPTMNLLTVMLIFFAWFISFFCLCVMAPGKLLYDKFFLNIVPKPRRWPHIKISMAFWFILTCPLFYTQVYLPCSGCYDFETTIAHEVGHVLGFNHPDAFPNYNFNQTLPMSNTGEKGSWDCENFLVGVENTKGVFDPTSIMASILTKSRPRTCLTYDDAAGLDFLYPPAQDAEGKCNVRMEPVCNKVYLGYGLAKMTATIVLPFIFATLLMNGVVLFFNAIHKQSKTEAAEEALENADDESREAFVELWDEFQKETENSTGSDEERKRRKQQAAALLKASIQEHLPPDAIKKIQTNFTKLDVDHSGSLSLAETGHLCKAAGLGEIQGELLAEFFDIYDRDGSGALTLDEFVPMFKQLLDERNNKGANEEEAAEQRKRASSVTAAAKHELKPAMAAKLQELFNAYDADESGALSMQELQAILHELGSKLSKPEMTELFGKYDHDHGGDLSFDEFVMLYKYIQPGGTGRTTVKTDALIRDMFGKFDTNQNGTLDLAEVLQGTSKFGVDIDTKYLEQCFHNLDKNGDDKLDFDEFRCMYKSLFTDNLSEAESQALYWPFSQALEGSGVTVKIDTGHPVAQVVYKGKNYAVEWDGPASDSQDELTFKTVEAVEGGICRLSDDSGFVNPGMDKDGFVPSGKRFKPKAGIRVGPGPPPK